MKFCFLPISPDFLMICQVLNDYRTRESEGKILRKEKNRSCSLKNEKKDKKREARNDGEIQDHYAHLSVTSTSAGLLMKVDQLIVNEVQVATQDVTPVPGQSKIQKLS